MMLIAIMPHKMTRPEVAKRLGIKAMADATPGISYRELARYFSTSYSAVRDALRYPVARWARMLEVAPPPSQTARVTPAARPVAAIPLRLGSRANACLETPEPTVTIPEPVNFDVPEPVIDDDAIDAAYADADEQQDRVLRGVAENDETSDC